MGKPLNILKLAKKLGEIKSKINPSYNFRYKIVGLKPGEKIHETIVDDKEINKYGYVPVGKEKGLELADYVTIHLPLNEKTKDFIDKEELRKMKKTAVVVNTSRGGIINEKALFEA